MDDQRIREGMNQLTQLLVGAAESNTEVNSILEDLFTIGGTVYLTGIKAYGGSEHAIRASMSLAETRVDLIERSEAEGAKPTLEEWKAMAAERRRLVEEEM